MTTVIQTPKKNPAICSSWVRLEYNCHQHPHVPMPSVTLVTRLHPTPGLSLPRSLKFDLLVIQGPSCPKANRQEAQSSSWDDPH